METSSHQLLEGVLDLMSRLARDWEYSGPITPDTRFFADLGFESLDLVVLGTAIQERYGRVPFAQFLADLGQRPNRDVTVGELVEFVYRHRQDARDGGSP